MSLEAEFDSVFAEVGEWMSEEAYLVDDDDVRIRVNANVGEFSESREFSERTFNQRITQMAEVVLLRADNAALARTLRTRKLTTIPTSGWSFRWKGEEFPISSLRMDSVAWSFVIEQRSAS